VIPEAKILNLMFVLLLKFRSYPSWDIKGEKLSGAQLPEDLAKESGYTGTTDFKYTISGR
jgi:hypothetical protein